MNNVYCSTLVRIKSVARLENGFCYHFYENDLNLSKDELRQVNTASTCLKDCSRTRTTKFYSEIVLSCHATEGQIALAVYP